MNETYIKDYINLFSHLSLNNIEQFDNCIDKDIMFSDPFNYIRAVKILKKFFITCSKMLRTQALLF